MESILEKLSVCNMGNGLFHHVYINFWCTLCINNQLIIKLENLLPLVLQVILQFNGPYNNPKMIYHFKMHRNISFMIMIPFSVCSISTIFIIIRNYLEENSLSFSLAKSACKKSHLYNEMGSIRLHYSIEPLAFTQTTPRIYK